MGEVLAGGLLSIICMVLMALYRACKGANKPSTTMHGTIRRADSAFQDDDDDEPGPEVPLTHPDAFCEQSKKLENDEPPSVLESAQVPEHVHNKLSSCCANQSQGDSPKHNKSTSCSVDNFMVTSQHRSDILVIDCKAHEEYLF